MRCPVCREILATSDLGLQSHWRRRKHEGMPPQMDGIPTKRTEAEDYESTKCIAVARACLLPNAYNRFAGMSKRLRPPSETRKGGF